MFVRNKCAFNFDSNIRGEGTKIIIIESFVSISLIYTMKVDDGV